MSAYPYQFDIAAERGFRARRSGTSSFTSEQSDYKLPARVTAIWGGKAIEVEEPVKPTRTTAAPSTTRIGSVLRRKAEKLAETVAPKVEVVEPAPVVIAHEVIVEPAPMIDTQAEEARKAAEERKRLAKPADRGTVADLANALGQKRENNGTHRPKKNRSTGISLEELRRSSKATDMIVPRLSQAEIDRQLGLSKGSNDSGYSWWNDPKRKKTESELEQEARRRLEQAFVDRIRALDPRVVARLHRDSGIRHTWPSIERMLDLLKGDGRGYLQTDWAEKMTPFLVRCEQG